MYPSHQDARLSLEDSSGTEAAHRRPRGRTTWVMHGRSRLSIQRACMSRSGSRSSSFAASALVGERRHCRRCIMEQALKVAGLRGYAGREA